MRAQRGGGVEGHARIHALGPAGGSTEVAGGIHSPVCGRARGALEAQFLQWPAYAWATAAGATALTGCIRIGGYSRYSSPAHPREHFN